MPQTLVTFMPTKEARHNGITYANAVVEATQNQVTVIIGASVSLRRQVEIRSAIEVLRTGLKSRRLATFDAAAIFTCVNINDADFNNRRTAGTAAAASFTANDVAISMGSNVWAGRAYTTMLDSAIQKLTNALFEKIKDQAA